MVGHRADTNVFCFFNVSLIVECNDLYDENGCPDQWFQWFQWFFNGFNFFSQIEARALEKQHPVDTSPPPKQTCEKCKMKLEKEAGEMDVQNLGVYLQMVCEREGGDTALCVRIGKQYHANQLHDEQNLDMALGRFCTTFYDVPCKDDEEEKVDGGRVRRLRRRRLR